MVLQVIRDNSPSKRQRWWKEQSPEKQGVFADSQKSQQIFNKIFAKKKIPKFVGQIVLKESVKYTKKLPKMKHINKMRGSYRV